MIIFPSSRNLSPSSAVVHLGSVKNITGPPVQPVESSADSTEVRNRLLSGLRRNLHAALKI